MKCDDALYNYRFVNINNKIFSNGSRAREVASNRSYALLYDYYETQRKKQGFLGKLFNEVKNVFGFRSGSRNVEKKLDDYKLNPNDKEIEDNAIKVVNKYARSQIEATSVVRNVFSAMCAGAVSLLVKNKINNASLKGAISIASGAIGAIGLKLLDAKSAKRKYSKNEIINDTVQGAVSGALNWASDLILLDYQSIKSTFAKKLLKFGFKVFVKSSAIATSASVDTLLSKDKNFAKYSKYFSTSDILKDESSEIEYYDPRNESNQTKSPDKP